MLKGSATVYGTTYHIGVEVLTNRHIIALLPDYYQRQTTLVSHCAMLSDLCMTNDQIKFSSYVKEIFHGSSRLAHTIVFNIVSGSTNVCTCTDW